MSKKGFFSVEYYCGNGRNKKGCKADVLWRKSLLQMVLINELEVVDEENPPPIVERIALGEQFMLTKNRERWLTYLTPNVEELTKFKEEEAQKLIADKKNAKKTKKK
jgi:hypothetical protein